MKYPLLFLLFVFSACSEPGAPKNLRPVKLEFLETFTPGELASAWQAAYNYLAASDSSGRKETLALIEFQQGSPAGFFPASQLSGIKVLLSDSAVKAFFPSGLKFCFSMKPEEISGKSCYLVYAVRIPDPKKAVTGKDIAFAEPKEDEFSGGMIISLNMTPHGAMKWKNMTGVNIGRGIAIVLDDRVVSCPVVNDRIEGGETQISGSFTKEEAESLAASLNAGRGVNE